MTTSTHEMTTSPETDDNAFDQPFIEGLTAAADSMIDNPRRQNILERYITGEIHDTPGGAIAEKGGRVYWHTHGTFVAPDGSIFEVLADDGNVFQVYSSPADIRGETVDCMQPYTYDSFVGPYGIQTRVDFINGPNRCAPFNSQRETDLQRSEGCDVTVPRHQEGLDFDSRRDSIAFTKNADGSIEAYLHKSDTGDDVRLYSPQEVLAAVSIRQASPGAI